MNNFIHIKKKINLITVLKITEQTNNAIFTNKIGIYLKKNANIYMIIYLILNKMKE